MSSLLPVFGMPESLELVMMEARGWKYEAFEIAPGLSVARCRREGQWLYFWPGTDAEFGGWRTAPPDEYRVRTSIPYRLAGGAKPDAQLGPKIIYTTGYGNKHPEDLFASVKAVRGWLVDIRHWPHSRLRPEFDQQALKARFQGRYAHCIELGNVSHGSGEIQIDDLPSGIAYLEDMIANRQTPIVLLCACGKPYGCHRTTVADELRRRGHKTAELDWIQNANRKEEGRSAVVSSRA